MKKDYSAEKMAMAIAFCDVLKARLEAWTNGVDEKGAPLEGFYPHGHKSRIQRARKELSSLLVEEGF